MTRSGNTHAEVTHVTSPLNEHQGQQHEVYMLKHVGVSHTTALHVQQDDLLVHCHNTRSSRSPKGHVPRPAPVANTGRWLQS